MRIVGMGGGGGLLTIYGVDQLVGDFAVTGAHVGTTFL